jgi:hypothetical protein
MSAHHREPPLGMAGIAIGALAAADIEVRAASRGRRTVEAMKKRASAMFRRTILTHDGGWGSSVARICQNTVRPWGEGKGPKTEQPKLGAACGLSEPRFKINQERPARTASNWPGEGGHWAVIVVRGGLSGTRTRLGGSRGRARQPKQVAAHAGAAPSISGSADHEQDVSKDRPSLITWPQRFRAPKPHLKKR